MKNRTELNQEAVKAVVEFAANLYPGSRDKAGLLSEPVVAQSFRWKRGLSQAVCSIVALRCGDLARAAWEAKYAACAAGYGDQVSRLMAKTRD